MAPATGTAILVLVVFVLPGFVALRYAEQTYRTRADEGGLERVLGALYFSLLTYVLIAGGARVVLGLDTGDVRAMWQGEKPFEAYLALSVAGIAVPLAIADAARRWNKSRLRQWVLRKAGISAAHKTPSGWEHFFLAGRYAYVRATLKDGRVVGGFYGPGSFAGYTAETPDLYLERRFQIDPRTDWFAGEAQGTLGVYIRADEIVSVEFYEAGGPPEVRSWWRRLRSRMKRHGDVADDEIPPDPSDPEAGRGLPGRAGPQASDPAASGSE